MLPRIENGRTYYYSRTVYGMDHLSLLVEISALRVDATAVVSQGTFGASLNVVLRSTLEHGNELLAERECTACNSEFTVGKSLR